MLNGLSIRKAYGWMTDERLKGLIDKANRVRTYYVFCKTDLSGVICVSIPRKRVNLNLATLAWSASFTIPSVSGMAVFQSAVIYFIKVYVYLCHPHLIILSCISWLSQPIEFHNINKIQYRCPLYLLVFCRCRYRLVIDTIYDNGNVLRGLLKGNTVSKQWQFLRLQCPKLFFIGVKWFRNTCSFPKDWKCVDSYLDLSLFSLIQSRKV